ncbi:MAG TPA: hypothetical protein PLF84_11650 [Bryobacteraceae bacterium]|nr:hypothetical protein [Bryobacterales bacterium]HRJ19695.1 hypothetical protein [Bryobacteraceae bacterium]
MDYVKYYHLEDYLFTDVTTAFRTRGFLTPEEFFSIVIWKANRAKTAVKRRMLAHVTPLRAAVESLTRSIAKSDNDADRLRILTREWGFRLPMASAILTVLYPDRFTVYDFRVCGQLGLDDFSENRGQVEKYFSDFLPMVSAVRGPTSLRDKDRHLWGKSAYQSLRKFVAAY